MKETKTIAVYRCDFCGGIEEVNGNGNIPPDWIHVKGSIHRKSTAGIRIPEIDVTNGVDYCSLGCCIQSLFQVNQLEAFDNGIIKITL